jgi:drug/metabolite transporter (DMT)-like permease|nr:MAG: EamA family transporter [Pseudomonadota bacterium]
MAAAMAGFAVEDVLVKQMAMSLPVGQVLAMVGAGAGLVFGLISTAQGAPLVSRMLFCRPVMLRNFSEAGGSAAFVSALALTSLSGASAIQQATPLAVTLGAALFLGEKVRWRRWTAIVIGLVGVLLIIRPGMSDFDPGSLLALLSVFLLAARDLASRAVPPDVSSMQLAAWGMLSLVPAGLLMLLVTGTAPAGVAAPDLIRLLAILFAGGGAYYAIVLATRIGELSAVMPFRYARLVFALVLAYFVFGERPDGLMLLGSGLIVGTGLYTLWRTAQQARAAAREGG